MRFLFSLFVFFSYQGKTTDIADPTFPEIFEHGPDSLHEAVYKGDIKKVRNHIKKGADVNGRDIKSADRDLFSQVMATKNLSAVQASLGHTEVRMTQKYAKTVALLSSETGEKTADVIFNNNHL